MYRFNDRVVVVTGGAGGIGLPTAHAFLDEGARVAVIDKAAIPVASDKMLSLVLDASQETEVKRGIDLVTHKFGRIDILFNNCGVGASLDLQLGRRVVMQSPLEIEAADFDLVVGSNLKSAIWFVKHAVPHMPRSETSCIVSSSSIWSKGRHAGATAYTASKAALTAVTMSWAYGFAPIRAAALILGAIDTPMFRANPEAPKEISERTLLRRAGTPDEVASAVLFIASCRYLTATEIILDGGHFGR